MGASQARKVLLLAYFYPPEPKPGGLRPAFLAKYLPKFGWEVTVISRRFFPCDSEKHVIRTWEPIWFTRNPNKILQPSNSTAMAQRPLVMGQLRRVVGRLVHFPDPTVGWVPHALYKAWRLLASNRFDAILSTAWPPTVHVIASILAVAKGIPWLADYRDLWTGHPYLESRGSTYSFLQLQLERLLIQQAAALTAASPGMADSLQKLHNRNHVEIILNSFDPSEWRSVREIQPNRFVLCFAGQLYEGKRTPDLLFRATARLRACGDPAGLAVSFDFYGYGADLMRESAKRYGLEDAVIHHGPVDRWKALAAERSSAGLLIFIWDSKNTEDEFGSKFFEYLGAGRQIIAVGPSDSPLKAIINTLGVGSYASTENECMAALRMAYTRFVNGQIQVSSNSTALYGAEEMSRKFACVLDSITA